MSENPFQNKYNRYVRGEKQSHRMMTDWLFEVARNNAGVVMFYGNFYHDDPLTNQMTFMKQKRMSVREKTNWEMKKWKNKCTSGREGSDYFLQI